MLEAGCDENVCGQEDAGVLRTAFNETKCMFDLLRYEIKVIIEKHLWPAQLEPA